MSAPSRPVPVPSRRWARRLATLAASVVMVLASSVTPVVAEVPEHANDRAFLHGTKAAEPITALSTPVAGFSDTVAISGLLNPTAVRFASDGRVVVAQKSGRVLVYPSLGSSSPVLAANISTNVHDFWDRGLLGLALDPAFATNGNLYVLYTYDHILGSAASAPRWGDTCSSPPGATTDGCVVSARLSRLTLTNNVAGAEQVLIEDWCQQFPSHTIGALEFGADGFLYASSGDGASFNTADWGQLGGSAGSPTPVNPCGDPPGSAGVANSSPSGRGGALRSQSLRRPAGEPVTLDGTIIRIDPGTGSAAPSNPLAGSSSQNAARIVAHGLRNPFRIAFRPGTNDLWIGDVGWNNWEEINRLPVPTTSPVRNFGWPCYEGAAQHSGYSGLTQCANLYADGGNPAQAPLYAYHHNASVVSGDGCPTGGSAITGLAFYQGGNYPSKYGGALFFADHSRNCIWAMLTTNGIPDPAKRELLVAAASHPVDLQIGPNGDLFYVDLEGGTVHRLTYANANTPPSAVATATPSSGVAPLDVAFDGRGSSDADGDAITYAWDFTNDGTTDATTSTAAFRYSTQGAYTARLTVRDARGATATTTLAITANNSAPQVTITAPTTALTWTVNQGITFGGSASDPQDGAIPPARLSWTFTIFHCTTPSNCHSHDVETRSGISGGTFQAPDHEYPSYLQLALTATDTGGLSTTSTVRVDPQTVDLTFTTTPNTLPVIVNGTSLRGTAAAPTITKTVIVNSQNSIDAPLPQVLNGVEYTFSSWSDGSTGPSRTIVAPASWGSPLGATFVPSSADLSVSQAGTFAGSSVTWTLTAANAAGGLTASGVTVTDTLSPNLGAPTFNAPGWSCTYAASTRRATCVLTSLAPGATSQIRMTSPVVARKANKAENAVSIASQTRDVAVANNSASGSIRLR